MSLKTGGIVSQSDFTGMIWSSVCRVAPGSSEWLPCDGSAVARGGANASLFAALCPTATVTITIASPGVVTWNSHNLVNGDIVVFTSSGSLPTGITSGSQYFVVNAATNTFQIALNRGGTAINTTGSQSGIHTGRCFTHGIGNGSTTFNVPDLRGRVIIGTGTGSKVLTLPAIAISGNAITINNAADLPQGSAVLYTGASVTGLSNGVTYYVISNSATSIKLASSQANANAGTVLSISGTPSTDTLTITLSARILGDTGGEENHGISKSELASHSHTWGQTGGGSPGLQTAGFANAIGDGSFTSGSNSGDAQHNNMMPFASLYYYIHI